MGQPILNIVKAICSLIAAMIYLPFAYLLLAILSSHCRDCDPAIWFWLFAAGWVGPATIIFLILVEVDKPSPWASLRRIGVFKRGSLTSYGVVLIALLIFMGLLFGYLQSMVCGQFSAHH